MCCLFIVFLSTCLLLLLLFPCLFFYAFSGFDGRQSGTGVESELAMGHLIGTSSRAGAPMKASKIPRGGLRVGGGELQMKLTAEGLHVRVSG